jgi:homoserine dehydrogenase
MPDVEVLKFGSSVLRTSRDLHIAVDEIYRRWRGGYRILAVVSAFESITDELMAEVADVLGAACPGATAAYVATGEQRTAALLMGSLQNSGIPSRVIDPREIGLIAEGSLTESTPVRVDEAALEQLWSAYSVLVIPGFYGIDSEGRVALFGRGGSDLSALFLAAALGAECRLCKDVTGVYDTDPASSTLAHRFSALSWERAVQVAGPLIQPKALRYAQSRALAFEVGRPNAAGCTRVGHMRDEWAAPATPSRPLGIALVGCGTVGRGVYEAVRRYGQGFEVRHVVVREAERYVGILPSRPTKLLWRRTGPSSPAIPAVKVGGSGTPPPSEARCRCSRSWRRFRRRCRRFAASSMVPAGLCWTNGPRVERAKRLSRWRKRPALLRLTRPTTCPGATQLRSLSS